MKVHQGFGEWMASDRAIASIGNFDGVHLGHQAILRRVVEISHAMALQSVVITFDPVPKKILAPEKAPLLIQTLDQRLAKLASFGIDHTIVVFFNREFAAVEPEQFVEDFLVKNLRIAGLVVGLNFSFGRQKKGNLQMLRDLGEKHDFLLEGIPEIKVDGMRISSTFIRDLIGDGRVEEAARYLGGAFTLTGRVARGRRLGTDLGIPTANLLPENELLPARGVYITEAILDSTVYPSVTNAGVRPTVDGSRLVIEAHLLDFAPRDLYDRKMDLAFLQKMRDEKKFASLHDLKSQLASDVEHAKTFFRKRSMQKQG